MRHLKHLITKSNKTALNTIQTDKLPRVLLYHQEFLNGKDVLPEKDFLGKAATRKRFEYSPLRKELQAQTGIAKDQYKKQPICATRWKIMKFIAEIE